MQIQELSKNIFLACIAMLLGVICVSFFFRCCPFEFLLIGVPCGIIVGLILHSIVSPGISGKISSSIFYPANNNENFEEEYSQILAKIATGNFSDAKLALEDAIRKKPNNPRPVKILADLLIEKLQDTKRASQLLETYLSNKKQRETLDAELVLYLVDIYLDRNDADAAKKLLSCEIREKYPENAKKSLQKRLDSIICIF